MSPTAGGGSRGRNPLGGFLLADQKFTEPVALSSTCHVDLPLARSASVTGFDLVVLRARCMANLRPAAAEVKHPERTKGANCAVSVLAW